jgi:hypothetical protein
MFDKRGLTYALYIQMGRKTTVPDHESKDVPRGLLMKFGRYDLEMTLEDFFGN